MHMLLYMSILTILTLGDRIAIISEGSLLSCGSLNYLKHRFGYGYKLTLVTKTSSDHRHSALPQTTIDVPDIQEVELTALPPEVMESLLCNETKVTNFVKSTVSSASLIEKQDQVLVYHLPLLHAHPQALTSLFSQLEEQKEKLGIVAYTMKSSTLEEVSTLQKHQ